MIHEKIGRCDLYLGDCRESDLETVYTDAIVSDPPYGLNYVARPDYHQTRPKLQNDDNLDVWKWVAGLTTWHSKYVFTRWDFIHEAPEPPNSLITWVKNNWGIGDLVHEHGRMTEVCLFWPGKDHVWPDKRPSDVITAPRTGNEEHPTQKPIYVMEQIVAWTCGQVVDPCMGSGTTGLACIRQNRDFVGYEIDRDYFDIACERIAQAQSQGSLFL